jgi:hypothetical protein
MRGGVDLGFWMKPQTLPFQKVLGRKAGRGVARLF